MIAYLTDVEGQWDKLASFVTNTECIRFDRDNALVVAPGSTFVFGGDAIDRGPGARHIVKVLLDLKRRQPDQVVLLAGNRDINKMRLVRELAGFPPEKAPPEMRGVSPGVLLPWIFAHTMGARSAFEHRRVELLAEGREIDDESVAQSFLKDLGPDGELTQYLAASQLAWLRDGTLVVHGAVTDESLGVVPGHADRISRVSDWVDALNTFYRDELSAWRASLGSAPSEGHHPGGALIAYQAPIGETKLNQASVVYGRTTDEHNTPRLASRAVVDALRLDGVQRLLVGHTPSGDAPALLRDEGFTYVMADNSYGRVEGGSRVYVEGDVLTVRAETVLDNGRSARVRYSIRHDRDDPLLGMRDAESGQIVKARLTNGDYLLFRGLPNNKVEQVAVTAGALRGRTLAPPYR